MFLLVSGWAPTWRLHTKFLRISRTRKIAVTWILAGVFAYLPSFFSQILDLIYWTVLIFILIGVTPKTSNSLCTRLLHLNFSFLILFLGSLVSGLRESSAGSLPEQRQVIEPTRTVCHPACRPERWETLGTRLAACMCSVWQKALLRPKWPKIDTLVLTKTIPPEAAHPYSLHIMMLLLLSSTHAFSYFRLVLTRITSLHDEAETGYFWLSHVSLDTWYWIVLIRITWLLRDICWR